MQKPPSIQADLPRAFQQSNNPKMRLDLDQQLHRAEDFSHHLAIELSKFQQELNDWQTCIACLQGFDTSVFDSAELYPSGKKETSMTSIPRLGSTQLYPIVKKEIKTISFPAAQDEQLEAVSPKQITFNVLEENDKSAMPPNGHLHNELADDMGPVGSLGSESVISFRPVESEGSIRDRARDANPQLHVLWTAAGQGTKRLPSADRVEQQDSENVSPLSIHKPLPAAFLNRLVIHPSSPPRYILDILSLLVVVYDIISFPLAVFQYERTRFAKVMRVATIVYWTFDLFASFFAGYNLPTGEIEMRFWMTAKKALFTMAPFDFFIVAIDWFLLAVDSTKALASVARLTKVSRLLRIMRLLRLVRAARLLDLIERMKTWPASAAMLTFLNVARLIFNLSVINHFLGCGWYFVGTQGDDGETWVTTYMKPNDSMIFSYLVSYHWSIAQFTPCPIQIHPVNLEERLYTITITIFGLILFASLFGNVTAIINASRKNAYEAMMAEHNLKEFLIVNKVPIALAQRIQTFLRKHRIRKTRVLEADVPRLATLTSSLRQELHYQVHGPILKAHPLFRLLSKTHHDTFVHNCHSAATMTTVAQAGEIFHYRTKLDRMLFVVGGSLAYTAGRQVKDTPIKKQLSRSISARSMSSVILNKEACVITSGEWICEQPMWLCQWEARGRLNVVEQSDLVTINCPQFLKSSAFHRSSLPLFKRYAELFARKMCEEAASDHFAIDDLWGTRHRHSAMSEALASFEAFVTILSKHMDDPFLMNLITTMKPDE